MVKQGTTPRRVLVMFATRHESTVKVAETVAEELKDAGLVVEVKPVTADVGLGDYDAVVVGGPMIMGWHRGARRFLKQHRERLAQIPIALFMTAMSLTDTGDDDVRGVPVYKDQWLAKPPGTPGKLSFRERYSTPAKYLGDALDGVPELKPVAVAFFGGSLDLTTMNVFEKLFVLLIVRATPGDARNFKAIREWSDGLASRLSPARADDKGGTASL